MHITKHGVVMSRKLANSVGMHQIAAERMSQLDRGYDDGHDAKHVNGELIAAADAYLDAFDGEPQLAEAVWPFDPSSLHINSPVSSLAKAGALIAAEIDRRWAAGECKESDFGHPVSPKWR